MLFLWGAEKYKTEQKVFPFFYVFLMCVYKAQCTGVQMKTKGHFIILSNTET